MRVNHVPDPGLLALQRLMLLAPQRAAHAASAATMAEPVEPVMPAAAPTPVAHASPSVEMLVAIAATSPEARRRRLVQDAEQGLGGLERLLRADRLGSSQTPQLQDLAAWIANHEVPDDPAAQALVRDIELRVLVELAKRDGPVR